MLPRSLADLRGLFVPSDVERMVAPGEGMVGAPVLVCTWVCLGGLAPRVLTCRAKGATPSKNLYSFFKKLKRNSACCC